MLQWLVKVLKAIKGSGWRRHGCHQGKGPHNAEEGKARVDVSLASLNAWYRQ
jgi:hypothetical protein